MSATRLREMTKTYERRRAAEVMAEVPHTSSELAHEAIDVMRERVEELEAKVADWEPVIHCALRYQETGSDEDLLNLGDALDVLRCKERT